MSRHPAWLTDLVPTLGDDGLDISTIGLRDHPTSLPSSSVPPRTGKSSRTRKSQRPQGTTRTQTQTPTTAASATTGTTAKDPSPIPAATPAPTAPASAPDTASASASASRRSRAADRKARNTSMVSDNLDTSEYVNLDLNQLHVDSDSDDSDARSSRRLPAGAGHSRSLSNPFPSLFSPKKKKKQHRGHSPLGFGDSASSEQDEPLPSLPVQPRNATQTYTNIGASGSSGVYLTPASVSASASRSRKTSFSTGPCITCGSLMRWAHGVEAFRCGICLTVNDLMPAAAKPPTGDPKDAQSRSASVGPISIEETRAIVNKCIRYYLEAVLCDVPAQPRGTQPVLQNPTPTQSKQPVNPAHTSASRSLTGSNSLGRPYDQPHSQFKGKATNLRVTAPEAPPQETPRMPIGGIASPHRRSLSSTHTPLRQNGDDSLSSSAGPSSFTSSNTLQPSPAPAARPQDAKEAKKIFRPLEDYIISHIFSINCLDVSFLPEGHSASQQNTSDISHPKQSSHSAALPAISAPLVPEKDARYCSGGDRADKTSWWSNAHGRGKALTSNHLRQASEGRPQDISSALSASTSRPILVDWSSVEDWYDSVINSGATWELVYTEFISQGKCSRQPRFLLEQIEANILQGQEHAQRVLLKAVETVLKRPGRRISESGDFRFLVIALANPLLHASCKPFGGNYQQHSSARHSQLRPKLEAGRGSGPAAGQHSVIIKRILGLLSNSSDDWHSRIISCFARLPEAKFHQTKDLVGGFLAYRLVRYNEKREEKKTSESDSTTLVPKVAEGASAASFHAALNQATGSTKKPKQPTEKKITHGDDWQIKAAVRVLGLLFAANNLSMSPRRRPAATIPSAGSRSNGTSARARLKGQIVPTSDFYITLLDNSDLVADFEEWEQQTKKFNFCQYPFLLSVWAKIQILEYEARRQMKNKARDAFFDSIMTQRNFDQHLVLNVRRGCLVEDSLKGVSAAIGSGSDDIKKGLRIIFNGEEGIDAGGLRKEWFLLLVREVFNPDHGMFVYDDESQYCYFSPASFETSDQFFLVGVVLGLAIYNSTILDVALPPFAFRKLLLAAPSPAPSPGAALPRASMKYTLSDLAEYRPRLAKGLQQLLDFDGDVEDTFCLEFTITVDRYGHADTVPLCPGGDKRTVTNANREEYVSLYIRYLLDTSVSRQFEPFKRGFYTVCGCNALGLFRPEEIELLVRGSDEPLDVASLRLAASYENWPSQNPLENEPTIKWLWALLAEAPPQDQRRLLVFVTGSDRIPATGPASLSIRVLCLGDDTGRFPTARTCFNTLTLYRYASKEAMRARLWRAVNESEGFGLK